MLPKRGEAARAPTGELENMGMDSWLRRTQEVLAMVEG